MLKSLVKGLIRLAFPYVLRCQNYFRSLVFENLELYKHVFGLEGVNNLLLHATYRQNAKILRRFGAAVGEGTMINSPLTISPVGKDYSNLQVGRHVWIGRGVSLDLIAPIVIGDNVTVIQGCSIVTHLNVMESPLKKTVLPEAKGPVVLERGCFIGSNVTILHGVTVGECAVVGAGAIVTKDVPANSLAAGVPARVVKRYEQGG